MAEYVSWRSCGAVWTGKVKLRYKGSILVKLTSCSDPKANIPSNHEDWVLEKDLV